MESYRIIITASDIALITGRSIRTARRRLKELREIYGKDDHQHITAQEYSVYSGIPLEDIQEHLRKLG